LSLLSQQQHKITKIIKNNSIEYKCENHNNTSVSYPTKKSLEADHPNLEELLIVICDLKSIPDESSGENP